MDPLYASPRFGNPGELREFISLTARAVLVEKVLKRASGVDTQTALEEIGVKKRISAVMLWMRQTRRWLGLPPLYPSKISDRYKESVEQWIADHGFPSREEILGGWLPGKPVARQ